MPFEIFRQSDGSYSIRPAAGKSVDGVSVFIDAARAMIEANKLNKAMEGDQADTDIEVENTIIPDEVRQVGNQYYYVYSIKPEEVGLGADEPTIYFYYFVSYST